MISPAEKTKQVAEEAAEAARPAWVAHLARLGYLAIGTVYLLIGALAVLSLFGGGNGRLTGSGGAARTLLAQPYGKVLLGVITLGLVVYVVWRFGQALFDLEDRGSSPKGILQRFGLALSGLAYLALAVALAEWLISGRGALEDPRDDWTVRLLSHPLGVVLVGLLGAAIIGVGLYGFYAAYRAGFFQYLDSSALGKVTKPAVSAFGRFGVAARGVVFLLIGGFLISAALQHDPQDAKGLGEVLRTLRDEPYGNWLIGLLAFGLLAFGLYMLLKVRYRHVEHAVED